MVASTIYYILVQYTVLYVHTIIHTVHMVYTGIYIIYLLRIPNSLSLTTIKSHKLISAIPSVSSFSASSPYPSFTKLVVLHRLQQTNGSPKKMRSSNLINKLEIMPASHILNSCRPDRLTVNHIKNALISHTSV